MSLKKVFWLVAHWLERTGCGPFLSESNISPTSVCERCSREMWMELKYAIKSRHVYRQGEDDRALQKSDKENLYKTRWGHRRNWTLMRPNKRDIINPLQGECMKEISVLRSSCLAGRWESGCFVWSNYAAVSGSSKYCSLGEKDTRHREQITSQNILWSLMQCGRTCEAFG